MGDLLSKDSAVGKAIDSVLCRKISSQHAATFVKTKEALDWCDGNGYMMSLAGHSLGGFLAELAAYFCFFDFKRPDVPAFTFDSPGSRSALVKFRSNVYQKEALRNEMSVPITCYLSRPSFLNICDEHVCQHIYCLFPNLSDDDWATMLTNTKSLADWSTTFRSIEKFGVKLGSLSSAITDQTRLISSVGMDLCGNTMVAIVEAFDPATGLPRECVEVRRLRLPHLLAEWHSVFSVAFLLC
jgi:hypothetical protein